MAASSGVVKRPADSVPQMPPIPWAAMASERVVDSYPVYVDERRVHHDAGDKADYDGRPRGDEGAGRGDGDERRDRAVAAHPDVDVALIYVAHAHRAEHAGCGRQGGGEGDVRDLRVAAIVEPGLKPYQPTHRIRTPSTASGML